MEQASNRTAIPLSAASLKLRKTFWWLVAFMLAYLVLLSSVLLVRPVPKAAGMFPSARLRCDPAGNLTFASHFGTWDAEHYLVLSNTGYQPGIAQCAFYPLWPLLVKWFSVLAAGDHILSGMILANAFSLAAFLLFFQLVRERFGAETGVLSLGFLLAFPGSLFFHFIYSESLFFLLLMALLLALERNQFGLALIAAFLLPLTRAVGIFCVLPLFVHLIARAPPDWWFTLGNRPGTNVPARGPRREPDSELGDSNRRTNRACYWLLAAPFAGWALYFLLMWHWTGDPFEGFKAQRQWGNVQSIANLFDPLKFISGFANPTDWHAFSGSALDRLMFVLLLWCLPVIWRLDKAWFLWALVLGIVPAMSGTFTSFTRFESVVFPFFVALAVFLGRPGLRWLSWLLLGVFALLHLVLLWRFVNFSWAG